MMKKCARDGCGKSAQKGGVMNFCKQHGEMVERGQDERVDAETVDVDAERTPTSSVASSVATPSCWTTSIVPTCFEFLY
jgi:hypothetical protein